MFPQTPTEQPIRPYNEQPTSPWTEAYQACPAEQTNDGRQAALPQRPYDTDTQSPTHDALSAVYNQGY